eukprot:1161981-Pelagomonas_calceolata.AAC.8
MCLSSLPVSHHCPHLHALCDVPQPDGDVIAATENVQLARREARHVGGPLVGFELAQQASAVGVKHLRESG